MVLLANRFPRLTSLPTFAIFVSGTSDITAILKCRSVNPINPINLKTLIIFVILHAIII